MSYHAMTIPRAIAMLQDFIDFKVKAAALMRNGSNESSVGDLARQAADLHDKERGMLEQILQELGTESKKTVKTRTEPTVKDMITKQVRIEVAKEFKKVKRNTRRKKQSKS